jgi:hypothetical protein
MAAEEHCRNQQGGKMRLLATILLCALSTVALAEWRGEFDDNWLGRVATVSDPTNGLVGWWKLDETNGTFVADSSGNNNTGTAYSATWTPTGKIGGAYTSAANNYITIPDSASLQVFGASNAFTVSLWLKYAAVTNITARILAKANEPGVRALEFLWHGYMGIFICQSYDGSHVNGYWSSPGLANNQWHHYVFVRNSITKFYVDGVSETNAQGNFWAINFNNTLPITIFGLADHSNKALAGAVVDDIRLYNRALSSNEAATIYNLYR